MRRLTSMLAPLLLAVAVLSLAAATAPTSGVPAPSSDAASRAAEIFLVRPEGPRGHLVAHDMASGRSLFTLPPGVLAADGSRYASVTAFLGMVRLASYDPNTGRLQASRWLSGDWELQAFSPNGRWAALARHDRNEAGSAATSLSVVDLGNLAIVHTLRLDGDYEVEAVSASGQELFLIHYLPADAASGHDDRYLVRLYDLAADTLRDEPLVSKGSVDAVMTGRAWEGLASPDGAWLLTLYLNTRLDSAFIHALNLELKLPICLDLPSGEGDPARLSRYTMAMHPGGGRVYAANPALGFVAEHALGGPVAGERMGVVAFDPAPESAAAAPTVSVISDDGRRLYFASGSQIWSYDTVAQVVSDPYAFEGEVAGLGLSSDGQQLYAAGRDSALAAYEAASGRLVAAWR